jgi:hypothetical protein
LTGPPADSIEVDRPTAAVCTYPDKGGTRLEQGFRAGDHGRPAVRDASENLAIRGEAVVDDRELDHPVPGVLDVEGDLGAGLRPSGVSGGVVHADR